MKALELKVPPALWMLLCGGLMWMVDQLLPQFQQDWLWHQWAAITIFVVAVLLIATGAISFRLAKTTVDPTKPEKASFVVTTGIYRYTRNPMYFGFLLILMAFMFKLANPVTIMVLPLFVVCLNLFQIKPEERALAKNFGDNYLSYCQKVRRWV